MKKTILDYYADRRTPYLHGGGRQATNHLFHQLQFTGKERVLEIGFGIGASLLSLHEQFPNIKLHGVERTPKMYKTAQKRLKWMGLNPDLHLLKDNQRLPFRQNYFDVVYIESVLGILPIEEIQSLLFDIKNILKPNGKLGLNETLWLPWVPKTEKERINTECIAAWGIPQANTQLCRQEDWQKMLITAGFKLNYFAAHDAKSIIVKPSFKEQMARFQDRFIHYLSLLKTINRKENKKLKELPKDLFLEKKPYLNSFIIVGNMFK